MPLGYSNKKVLYLHQENRYPNFSFEVQIKLNCIWQRRYLPLQEKTKMGGNLIDYSFIYKGLHLNPIYDDALVKLSQITFSFLSHFLALILHSVPFLIIYNGIVCPLYRRTLATGNTVSCVSHSTCLHVLGMPSMFILSQDQMLHQIHSSITYSFLVHKI